MKNTKTPNICFKDVGMLAKHSLVFATFIMACFVLPAHGEARFTLPYVGGNLGLAKVQDPSGFSNSGSFNGYGGFYLVNNLSLELWTVYLGKFDVEKINDAYSESYGLGAAMAYRFDLGRLFALRPSVGWFYSQTEITYEGRNIGDDSGSDFMFGLSGGFTINEHILVNINTHLFKDVSGADIVSFTAGAGYQF